MEHLLNCVGDGGFARPTQAREPKALTLMTMQLGAGLFVDCQVLAMYVLRATQGKVDHACAHGLVIVAIHEHERTHAHAIAIGFEGNGFIDAERNSTDVVQLELPR